MQKIDPRTKLLMLACLSTLAVLAKDLIYLLIVFLIALLIDVLLSVKIGTIFKRTKHLLSVIVFITIVQSLFIKGGKPLIYIDDFVIVSSTGLIMGLEFMLRMAIIVCASLIMTTTDGREMADGLIKMKIPYEFAFMTSITLRFLPMFRKEFTNRINAITLRGIDIKKLKLNKKIKLYTYILTPTITSSILKSQDLTYAMVSRGFRAYEERTMLHELKLKASDYVVMFLILAFTGVFLGLMYTFGGLI